MRKCSVLLSFTMLVAAAGNAAADAPAGGPTTTVTEVKKDAPPRFYGVGMDWSVWDGSGLNAVNYSNSLSFLFEPTWNFGKLAFAGTRFSSMQLAGRFLVDLPFATYDDSNFAANSDQGRPVPCSNLTPSVNGGQIDATQVQRCPYERKYRAHQGDFLLTLRNPKIVTIPYAKINVGPSITATLPTSAEAQYQNLYLGIGVGVGVSRAFLDEKIHVGYSIGATKYFHKYNTANVPLQNPNDTGNVTNNYDVTQVSSTNARFLADPSHDGAVGGYTSDYGFRHVFSVDFLPTEKLSFAALYILIDSFKNAAQCDYRLNGQQVDVCANGDQVAANSGSNILRVGHVDQQVLWLTAGYQVLDWLNVNIAWINWSPQRKPDGSWRQPFVSVDYNAFTSISLGATVSLDKAAAKIF